MQRSEPLLPDAELPVPDQVAARPAKSLWRETLERLVRKPSAIVGMVILGTLLLIAIFAPLIATHDPLQVLLDVPEEGVGKRMAPCIHLLGCPNAGDTLLDKTTASPIAAVALSSTNSMIAAAAGDTVEVWSAGSGKELMTLAHAAPVRALDWSPNDQKMLAASGDEITVWDMNQRAINRTVEHPGGADLVRWNADGTRFLSADAHTIRLWDTLSWTQIAAIELTEPRVAAAWNSNGTIVMTASGSQVQLWNAFTGTEIKALEHPGPVTSAAFNGASTKILTTSGNTLRIWNASNYAEQLTIEHTQPVSHGVWIEAVARGIQYVAATDAQRGLVWSATTGAFELELTHGRDIERIAASPLATRLVTQGGETVRVWNARNGDELLNIDRSADVTALAWLSTGGGVMVASDSDVSIVKTSNYQYIMGVDGNLRDQFSRIIYGTRLSLMVGLTTVTFAVLLGTVAGAIAGYAGGWVDNGIMRVMDVMLAFPGLILAIAVVTVLGPGLINALLAISIVFIPAYARVARSGVLAVKEEDYVTADRALGVDRGRILFRRILPNALAPLIVQATLGIGTAILDAAALSFLGLGAQPPTPEWGAMLGAERNQVFTAPHLVFYPGIAIMLTVLAFNLLGDGLRDALDPRLDR